MKIKLDENLPAMLARELAMLGHDVDTVPQEGHQGGSDDAIWEAAQQAGRFLITQDMDFSDLRKFVFGSHCGVMLVRLREPGRRALFVRIVSALSTEECEAFAGRFVIVTERKIRVRSGSRPAQS
jgi:predicted nuclease of predicted toxin-antitoxin system